MIIDAESEVVVCGFLFLLLFNNIIKECMRHAVFTALNRERTETVELYAHDGFSHSLCKWDLEYGGYKGVK